MEREEAIRRIKAWNLDPDDREVLEAIIPELAESEDERMLREIKRYIKEQGDKPTGLPNGTVAISDMIAWFEKQKEHKPSGETNVEPNSKIPREEYLYHLLANHIITFTDYTYLLAKKPFDYECANIPQKDYTPVEQKPADLSEMMVHKEPYIAPVPTPMVADEQKPAWSDEDETAFGDLMWCIKQAAKSAKDENDIGNVWFAENWVKNRLKFLRPVSKESLQSWKPSEHQMTILKNVKDYVGKESGYWGEGLGSLIDDLEKLM